MDLALVIGSAATEEIAVANGWFESGRGPKVEGFRRLHIVVAVKKHGWFAGGFERLGIDERMEICGNNFNFLKSSGAQIVRHPPSGAFDVRFVFALGADARDSQKLAQLCQMLVAITFYKFSKVHKRGSRGLRVLSNKIKN